MAYTVYCHTCKRNGKKYIGLTKVKPEKRWNHGKSYQGNDKFWHDIQKYGWDKGFTHEIIASEITKEQAQELEHNLIEQFDTIQSGYNREPGGRAPEPTFLCSDLTRFRSAIKKSRRKPELIHFLEMLDRGDNDKDYADLLNEMCKRALSNPKGIRWEKPHFEDDLFLCDFVFNFSYEIRVCNWIANGCCGEMPKYKNPYELAEDCFRRKECVKV